MSFVQFPVSGILKVPNVAALPISAEQGDISIILDSGDMYEFKDGSQTLLVSTSGSGANTALSNLTTTAINQDLLPAATNTLTLGSATKAFASLDVVQLKLDGATSGTLTINPPATVTSYAVTMPSAQGAASTVLTNDGAGVLTWAAVPAAGANTALSNLTTTAINQSLIPATNLTLGTAANMWTTGYIGVLNDSSAVPAVNMNARFLLDSAGITSVRFGSRLLLDSAGVSSLSYGSRQLVDSSGNLSLDWQNKALVANGTQQLTWGSSVSINMATPLILNTLVADPGGVVPEGLMYYNTVTHTVRFFNGTVWGDL